LKQVTQDLNVLVGIPTLFDMHGLQANQHLCVKLAPLLAFRGKIRGEVGSAFFMMPEFN
jgi:hypothetical protein